ncbi:MAG: phosphoribosyltransferase family protein [Eubacteriales bacterium]|nr:phosphoribosyltransferase family protein [Eubacteriales bacterium]
MKKVYEMEIAGIKRELPLFPVNDNLSIAAFIIFGDVEITCASAKALLEKAPDYDILVTAEAKSIPLIHEMARQAGDDTYIVARKGPKVYMEDILTVPVNSITTARQQILCIGKKEVEMINGKRVLIIDDVISTGESLNAMEELVKKAGGNIAGKMAVLAEGDACEREDIIFLEPLPLFDGDGNPLV